MTLGKLKRKVEKWMVRAGLLPPIHTFTVRTEVMRELLADPEWLERFNNAKTTEAQFHVVADYCESHGFKVGSL